MDVSPETGMGPARAEGAAAAADEPAEDQATENVPVAPLPLLEVAKDLLALGGEQAGGDLGVEELFEELLGEGDFVAAGGWIGVRIAQQRLGRFGQMQLVFEDGTVGVEQGIKDAMERGFLAGYELVDIKVRLVDGNYHEVDSDERSFHIAGSLAFQDAVRKAKPVLLEPIMRIEVVTPDEYMGAVNGDLMRRRGQIEKTEPRPGGAQVITAFVPLSEMFGYTTDLRSATQGRATSTMHFERYEAAPKNVAEEIIAKVQGVAK